MVPLQEWSRSDCQCQRIADSEWSGRRQAPKVVAIISGTLPGWLRDWQSEFVISQPRCSQLLEQGMHSQVPLLLPPQHVQQNVTETTLAMPMQRRCILSRRQSYLWKTRANSSFHFSFIIYLCAHTFIYVCWQFCYTCCHLKRRGVAAYGRHAALHLPHLLPPPDLIVGVGFVCFYFCQQNCLAQITSKLMSRKLATLEPHWTGRMQRSRTPSAHVNTCPRAVWPR